MITSPVQRHGLPLAIYAAPDMICVYHNALAQGRRFESIADALDEPACRGAGVPRTGEKTQWP